MRLNIVLVSIFLFIANGGAGFTIARAQDTNHIQFDSRSIDNNQWGAPLEENLTSGIFQNYGVYGWYWSRLDPVLKPGKTFVQPIYPNVRIGGDPWSKSNTDSFPVKLDQVDSLKFHVDYEYPVNPSGEYNLSYEMYLSDSPERNSSAKAEIMVWVHRTFGQPPSTFMGTFSDGSNDYDLYSWLRGDGSLYASFIMVGKPELKGTHTVDVKKLLQILEQNKNYNVNSEWYILGVQMGSEIVKGSGQIQINSLSIDLNDNSI